MKHVGMVYDHTGPIAAHGWVHELGGGWISVVVEPPLAVGRRVSVDGVSGVVKSVTGAGVVHVIAPQG